MPYCPAGETEVRKGKQLPETTRLAPQNSCCHAEVLSRSDKPPVTREEDRTELLPRPERFLLVRVRGVW